MKIRLPSHTFLLLIAALAISGCSTPPINYYLMSPVPSPNPATGKHKNALGVGPIQLADYLNRPNLVTRTSATRIEVPREHKWGSTLNSHFTETLAENLRQRLGLDGVVIYPWQPGTRMDLQITADIIQFIYSEPDVQLEANWVLRNRSSGRLTNGFSLIREASSGDYDDIVAAMGRATGRLADEIALKVQQSPEWNRR